MALIMVIQKLPLFASIGEVDSVVQSSSEVLYSNPLPHVLILTAIVVGVATLAIGLSLVVRIREVYGTIEEDKIEEFDRIYYKEILERAMNLMSIFPQWIIEQGPAFLIVLPLLMGAVTAVIPNRRYGMVDNIFRNNNLYIYCF